MSAKEEWKNDYMNEILHEKSKFIKTSHIKMSIMLIASLCLFYYQIYNHIIGNFTSRNSKIFLVVLLIIGLAYIRFAELKISKYELMEIEFNSDMLDWLHYNVIKHHLLRADKIKEMGDRLEAIEGNEEKQDESLMKD